MTWIKPYLERSDWLATQPLWDPLGKLQISAYLKSTTAALRGVTDRCIICYNLFSRWQFNFIRDNDVTVIWSYRFYSRLASEKVVSFSSPWVAH